MILWGRLVWIGALGGLLGCSSSSAGGSPVRGDAGAADTAPLVDARRDGRVGSEGGSEPKKDGGGEADARLDGTIDHAVEAAAPDAPLSDAPSGDARDAAAPDAAADGGQNVIELAVGEDPGATTPVATVQISIGGSAPFTALVDTGSVGLHVVEGTIPDADWTVTSTTTSTTYGTGVITSGVIANAVVTIGGMATTMPIDVVKITGVSCVASKPNCPAAGETASEYRYRGDYPANIGIGMRANATENLASPLAAMGPNLQYLLELPALGGSVGTIVIDPTSAEMSRFATTLVQLASKGATTVSGVPGWDDTVVPYCLNSFCSAGILDTGAVAATINPGGASGDMQIGVATGATSVPSGTVVNMAIDTTATWSFTVGSPPVDGKDAINLGGSTVSGSDNLSIAPFFVFDMFYDYGNGRIGLATKL